MLSHAHPGVGMNIDSHAYQEPYHVITVVVMFCSCIFEFIIYFCFFHNPLGRPMVRTLHIKPQRSIEVASKHHVQYQTCPSLPSYM